MTFLRCIGAWSLCGAAAFAQTPKKPVFITAEQLPILQILPAPPANDSVRGKAELAEVHRIQETRTAAEIAHAKADDAEEDMFIFKDVMGEKFTAANLPATALLSAHMHNDEGIVVNPAKQFFAKRRPFHFDATVKPVCKTNSNVDDFGYPSGHGTTGYLEALVLVQIAPEKRDAILDRADDYAHSRVVCGVHYPSDGQASKLTAYAMMGIIMNNPEFRKELEAAKAETRALLGLKAGM
jgi:acid phosphatase (class A)